MPTIAVGAVAAPTPSYSASTASDTRIAARSADAPEPFAQLVSDLSDDRQPVRRDPRSHRTPARHASKAELPNTGRASENAHDQREAVEERPRKTADQRSASEPERKAGDQMVDTADVPVTAPVKPADAALPTATSIDLEHDDAPDRASGASAEVLDAIGAVKSGERLPGAVGQAASTAAAAFHNQAEARRIALAALKSALAAVSSEAEGEGASGDDAASAAGLPLAPSDPASDATPPLTGKTRNTTANAVAAAQLPAAERQPPAEAGVGGDTSHEHSAGKRSQIAVPDLPASTRSTGQTWQAIAAFHAVAAAAETVSGQPAAVVTTDPAVRAALADPDLPASIVRSIHMQTARGGGEARISLNPGFLGEMTVGVQVDGASVIASLHASNADVREWIRTNEAMLRQALAEQGFNLDRLVIVEDEAAETTGDRSQRERDDAEQRPRRHRRAAAEGSFEALI